MLPSESPLTSCCKNCVIAFSSCLFKNIHINQKSGERDTFLHMLTTEIIQRLDLPQSDLPERRPAVEQPIPFS